MSRPAAPSTLWQSATVTGKITAVLARISGQKDASYQQDWGGCTAPQMSHSLLTTRMQSVRHLPDRRSPVKSANIRIGRALTLYPFQLRHFDRTPELKGTFGGEDDRMRSYCVIQARERHRFSFADRFEEPVELGLVGMIRNVA